MNQGPPVSTQGRDHYARRADANAQRRAASRKRRRRRLFYWVSWAVVAASLVVFLSTR